jgi:hypothetical protein
VEKIAECVASQVLLFTQFTGKKRRNVRKYQQRRPCGRYSQMWEDNTLPFLLPYMKQFNTKCF